MNLNSFHWLYGLVSPCDTCARSHPYTSSGNFKIAGLQPVFSYPDTPSELDLMNQPYAL